MPVYINGLTYSGYVYSKSEIDTMMELLAAIKMDKVSNATEDDIATLRSLDGNAQDSGYGIGDLQFSDGIDGGTY